MNIGKAKEQIARLEKNKTLIKAFQKQAIECMLCSLKNDKGDTRDMVALVYDIICKNGLRSYHISDYDQDKMFVHVCTDVPGFIECRDVITQDSFFDPCGSLVRAGERYFQQYGRFPSVYYERICQEIEKTYEDIHVAIEEYGKLNPNKKSCFRFFYVELESIQRKMNTLSDIKWKETMEGKLSEEEKESICDEGEKFYETVNRFWLIRDNIHGQLEKLRDIKFAGDKSRDHPLDSEMERVERKLFMALMNGLGRREELRRENCGRAIMILRGIKAIGFIFNPREKHLNVEI